MKSLKKSCLCQNLILFIDINMKTMVPQTDGGRKYVHYPIVNKISSDISFTIIFSALSIVQN